MSKKRAPAACCHDKYEWFDHLANDCAGCGITRLAWWPKPRTVQPDLAAQLPVDRVGVQILGDAADVIDGERQQNYGDPATNLGRIAALWSTILGAPVTAHQVALCMTGLKIARLIETPGHRDSYVDGAGYLALAAELTINQEDNP